MYRCNELGTTHMKLDRVTGDSRFVSPNRGEATGRLSSGCANCACIIGTICNPILALSQNIPFLAPQLRERYSSLWINCVRNVLQERLNGYEAEE